MTKEGFRRYMQRYVDAGIAFTAYWHPAGHGLLVTGPRPTYRTKYLLHLPDGKLRSYTDSDKARAAEEHCCGSWVETTTVEGPPKTVPKSSVARWHRLTEALRRRVYTLITVEFDGTTAAVEGGDFEL